MIKLVNTDRRNKRYDLQYYVSVEVLHECSYAILPDVLDAMMYVMNRWGKVSGFTENTPMEDMWWLDTRLPVAVWKWKGYPSDLYLEVEFFDTSFTDPGLTLFESKPDSLIEFTRKELEK